MMSILPIAEHRPHLRQLLCIAVRNEFASFDDFFLAAFNAYNVDHKYKREEIDYHVKAKLTISNQEVESFGYIFYRLITVGGCSLTNFIFFKRELNSLICQEDSSALSSISEGAKAIMYQKFLRWLRTL